MKKFFHQILPVATTASLALSSIPINAQETIFPYIDDNHRVECVICDTRSQIGGHIDQATSINRTLRYLLDMVEKQKEINNLLLQRIDELEQAIKKNGDANE